MYMYQVTESLIIVMPGVAFGVAGGFADVADGPPSGPSVAGGGPAGVVGGVADGVAGLPVGDGVAGGLPIADGVAGGGPAGVGGGLAGGVGASLKSIGCSLLQTIHHTKPGGMLGVPGGVPVRVC